MREKWKPIPGFEDAYEISICGKVRSITRYLLHACKNRKSHLKIKAGRVLKPGLSSNGYFTVALGRGNTRTLHSLLMDTFVGPKPKGMEIRHLNDNRLDNRLENLCYGTRTENIKDAVRNKTWLSPSRLAHLRKLAKNRANKNG